jgi:hypothetical protein
MRDGALRKNPADGESGVAGTDDNRCDALDDGTVAGGCAR